MIPWLSVLVLGSSPSVSTFFPISEFSYFRIRFFLSLTFPISLSDFTIELLSKKTDNEKVKVIDTKKI